MEFNAIGNRDCSPCQGEVFPDCKVQALYLGRKSRTSTTSEYVNSTFRSVHICDIDHTKIRLMAFWKGHGGDAQVSDS